MYKLTRHYANGANGHQLLFRRDIFLEQTIYAKVALVLHSFFFYI